MKVLYLLPFLMLSCKNEPAQTPNAKDRVPSEHDSKQAKSASVSLWDFNGDGKDDNDVTVKLAQSLAEDEDNPTQGNWEIIFNNKTLPNLHLVGGTPTPIGEGDLNGDGAAELTIVQEPNHGCTYDLTVWSFQKGKWKQVFGPELVPTSCEPVNADSIDSLIVEQNGKVYFYKADLNDEHFSKVKTEVKLKN